MQSAAASADPRETADNTSRVSDVNPDAGLAEQRLVTFNREIAPIIFQNCTLCHRSGEAAPFPLLSYDNVKKRSEQIVAVTQSRYMPPWLPKRGYGDFAGERRLTDEQIELIRRWAEQGSVEGDPSDLPQTPEFTEGWQLGVPDLVVRMPEAYTLRAEGTDVYRYFVIPVPVQSSRFVTRVELRPGNRKVIHHANILVDPSGDARRFNQQENAPELEGMATLNQAQYPAGHLLTWQPGTAPHAGREDKAWRLDAGTDLILNLHMLPSGKPEQIQPHVGFYFTDTLPTPPPYVLLQLENDRAIDIPAGKKDFLVTDTFTLPVDAEVIAVYPHAHLIGKDLQGYATLPDGTRQWLIWIEDWDWNWQAVYRYANPLELPGGSVLSMRYTYDNSDENVRNPSHPPRRVLAGNRTEDEMGHLWLQLLTRNTEDVNLLEEMSARHKLAKYPHEAALRLQLGIALAKQGRQDESIRELRKVNRARPDEPIAIVNLGVALLNEGNLEEAISHLRRALEIKPRYAIAQFNLGSVLAMQGKTENAIEHYVTALEINPALHDAHYELGMAFERLGDVDKAIRHYRLTLEIDPTQLSAHFKLGLALAARGELDAAIAHYRQALEFNPDMFVAHYNLAVALAAQGKQDEAIDHFRRALELNPPGDAAVHTRLVHTLQSLGSFELAIAHYRKALTFDQDHRAALNNLALVLATCPESTLRQPRQAVELAQRASLVADNRNPFVLRTLAAAYAAAGEFELAASTAKAALQLATVAGARELADEMRKRIEFYEENL